MSHCLLCRHIKQNINRAAIQRLSDPKLKLSLSEREDLASGRRERLMFELLAAKLCEDLGKIMEENGM